MTHVATLVCDPTFPVLTGELVARPSNILPNPSLKQISLVDIGVGAGPHVIHLTDDEKRLVVTDYFLNEDSFGKVHLEGDHKVHVIKVSHGAITLDPRFDLGFSTAFKTGPARPHGAAMK
jgi:hypothetical protein